jgi:transposase
LREDEQAAMLPTEKRREVRVLLRHGHPPREAARLSGVSVSTVRRIARESDPLPDVRERRRRRIGRPAKAARFAHLVRRLLERYPDLTSARILQLATSAGYCGRKSAMYDLVARVRRDLHACHGVRGTDEASLSSFDTRHTG